MKESSQDERQCRELIPTRSFRKMLRLVLRRFQWAITSSLSIKLESAPSARLPKPDTITAALAPVAA